MLNPTRQKVFSILSISAFAIMSCGSDYDELKRKIANLWLGDDSQRIEFVRWIDEDQSFIGLTQLQVRELLGAPTSAYDNQEFPFNGLQEKYTQQSLAAMGNNFYQPVMWSYRTLRKGSPESIERGGEGSSYLLDLIIQFGADGKVYGCGTNQFTTSSDYYKLLESKSR